MAINDTFELSGTAIADGSDFIIDGSGAGTGAVEVFELAGDGGANVYREIDPDGDGTWEITVPIDSPSGIWHSQKNQLVISQRENVRIRIMNTSGSTANYYAIGMEVSD